MAAVRTSVVIGVYDDSAHFRETVHRLMTEASGSRESVEVVLVDNRSLALTHEEVARLGRQYLDRFQYVREPRHGRSFALNAGIGKARGEIVAFTDDDIVVPRDWADALREALIRTGAHVVGGGVLPLWHAGRPSWLDEELFCKIGLIDYGAEARWLDEDHMPLGCNLAARRELFAAVGLYDTSKGLRREIHLTDEDEEFLTRVFRAGGRLFYEPKATVRRRIPSSRLRKSMLRRLEVASGISNARTENRRVAYLLNVPRYQYRRLLEAAARWTWLVLGGRWDQAFRQELVLWYLYGYLRARWMTPGAAR